MSDAWFGWINHVRWGMLLLHTEENGEDRLANGGSSVSLAERETAQMSQMFYVQSYRGDCTSDDYYGTIMLSYVPAVQSYK